MKNKGFTALFLVIIIGFISGMFLVSTSTQVWLQSKNVSEAGFLAALRFDAISCVNIARLKNFLTDDLVLGEYATENGKCRIENILVGQNTIFLETSSEKNGTKISFESKLDQETSEIIYIQEIFD